MVSDGGTSTSTNEQNENKELLKSNDEPHDSVNGGLPNTLDLKDIQELRFTNISCADLVVRRKETKNVTFAPTPPPPPPPEKLEDSTIPVTDKPDLNGLEKVGDDDDDKLDKSFAPEDWEDCFRYFQETNDSGDVKKVGKEQFWNTIQDADEPMGLVRQYGKATIKLELRSLFLRELYRDVAAKHEYHGVIIGMDVVIIRSPYVPFYHQLSDFREAVASNSNISPANKAAWQALEKFLETKTVRGLYDAVRGELSTGVVSLENVWAAFNPEEVVYVQDAGLKGFPSIMRLKSLRRQVRSWMDDSATPKGWVLNCVQISWNGRRFREEAKIIKIPPFAGCKKITDLKIFPLRLLADAEAHKGRALARGEKFRRLMMGQSKTMMYNGPARRSLVDLKFPWQQSGPPEPKEIQLNCRVVVDPLAFDKMSRYADLESHMFTSIVGKGPPQEDEDEENSLFSALLSSGAPTSGIATEHREQDHIDMTLCTTTYSVFALDDQEWFNVSIDDLQPVNWQPDAFKTLEITDDEKELLEGLTRAHAMEEEKRSSDMISGKGKGLIMLFYGPPGVGKTLTAEALAELTHKPLYRVNLGVVSTRSNWEANLDHIMESANDWKAILLIDEAEVVLEERSVQGGHQNTWVSVFLRKMEYFSGILVLTTNLVKIIDPAFQSRISIGIRFEDLSYVTRKTMWASFIDRMSPDLANRPALRKNIGEWAEETLNARQIRNIILTAESLVVSKGKTHRVEPEHIDRVVRHTVSFVNSVQNTKRDGKEAFVNGLY